MLMTLKGARNNVDLKQEDVVKILKERYSIEITRQKLAMYENDSSDISITLADALAGIYFLSRDEIFFGDKSTLSYIFRMKNKQIN